jgi:uncharacterized membrane protein (DUF373 family)
VTVTRAVNSALFIVVVLELIRTIVARLEGGGFQLQPLLVIGIISVTRDILTVGAELSLTGAQTPLVRTVTELGVNAGALLALSIALVLCGPWPGWTAPDRDVSATTFAPGVLGWPGLAALRMCWRRAETSVEL